MTLKKSKLLTVEQAVALIPSDVTVATSGFVGAAHPEALTSALEKRFLETGSPKNLTLFYTAGQGDGKDKGLNHLAHEGLIKRVIGGHWGLAPKMGKLANENKIEAYNFPQGVLCQLLREIAAKRPGVITKVGMGTWIDPELQGGRLNSITPPGPIERITLGGQPYIWYKSFNIHIALIRAASADSRGNLCMEEEVMVGDILPMAQAVHNQGGLVIAQVKSISDTPFNPHRVRVPGILVDHIVVADPSQHHMTFACEYDADLISAQPLGKTCPLPAPLPMDERRIIAVRALRELPSGGVVNLGIGMPEGIARIATETGRLDDFTLTIESGPIGGMPLGGLSFGASRFPQAIIDQPAQFDFYDGRGLEFSALGAAQIDQHGNVNVSKFGTRIPGVGGFVNISQSAHSLVFCGAFTAGDIQIQVQDGKLKILKEGPVKKFIANVEQISFSGQRSRQIGQKVLYVTERAVFELTKAGLELIEVAPGIDIDTHILAQMEFKPIINSPRLMPAECFQSTFAQ